MLDAELDEDLSALENDIEVRMACLSEAESQIKRRFWEAENRDWELGEF
jgi:hypothetical protein